MSFLRRVAEEEPLLVRESSALLDRKTDMTSLPLTFVVWPWQGSWYAGLTCRPWGQKCQSFHKEKNEVMTSLRPDLSTLLICWRGRLKLRCRQKYTTQAPGSSAGYAGSHCRSLEQTQSREFLRVAGACRVCLQLPAHFPQCCGHRSGRKAQRRTTLPFTPPVHDRRDRKHE